MLACKSECEVLAPFTNVRVLIYLLRGAFSDALCGCWLSIIVEYSVVLRIEQLAPLLETMQREVVLEMQ